MIGKKAQNVYFIVGNEEYTSKKCENCMFVNGDLKGERERELRCKNCGIKMIVIKEI